LGMYWVLLNQRPPANEQDDAASAPAAVG